MQLEWVINQYFEIDRYQPLLFIVDSFDHLFDLVGELEGWMREGRLDNVSPGEPAISEPDLRSFLEASAAEIETQSSGLQPQLATASPSFALHSDHSRA